MIEGNKHIWIIWHIYIYLLVVLFVSGSSAQKLPRIGISNHNGCALAGNQVAPTRPHLVVTYSCPKFVLVLVD